MIMQLYISQEPMERLKSKGTSGLHYGDATPEGPDAASHHESGWSFAGWTPAVEETVNGNAVYIAQWSRDEYSVTYQPGAHGTFEEVAAAGLHYGDATPEEPDAANNHEAGWRFTGWSPEVEATVSKTVTYVAQWEQEASYSDLSPQEDTEHLEQQQ